MISTDLFHDHLSQGFTTTPGGIMGRFVALWTKPADVGGFDDYYRNEHMALVQKWPGVRSTRVTRLEENPLGGEVPYYMLFEAEVEDVEVLLNSEALARIVEDAEEIMQRFGNEVVPITGAAF